MSFCYLFYASSIWLLLYPPRETSLKSCNLFHYSSIEEGSRRTLLRPFPLRWRPSLINMSSLPTKYPHKSTNPTPSSSHICSNSPLIAILLQFLNVIPLPLITGKIPESMICSTLVFFRSLPTLCFSFSILVVPSLSALFVPTCTNIDPLWALPQNVLYPFSHMLYPSPPGKQKKRLLLCLMSCLSFAKWSLPLNTLSVLKAPSITASE
ncbi:hypothetical protein NP493_2213g00007 [Ridgeia piscesae]|uniref:Uncharacterized protein n=1 Tax=Ridgeia piscesae TaxID=27915 RepID=A0AAD9JKN1_RIDPI|nr:hypothetical protein NP493_2213g00007 [Ridgeia piscesae]